MIQDSNSSRPSTPAPLATVKQDSSRPSTPAPLATVKQDTSTHAMKIPREIKLVGAALGLYATFIYWGYLQEKITSTTYEGKNGLQDSWKYPFFMNVCMSVMCLMSGSIMVLLSDSSACDKPAPSNFWKPALTSTLASPCGYASLQYITFPMLILAKSCKLVPVMLVGALVYGKRYSLVECLSVAMISSGVALFSVKPGTFSVDSEPSEDAGGAWSLALGLGLVCVNLALDGFTNSSQDELNLRFKISPFYMMKMMHYWASTFMLTYLVFAYVVFDTRSEMAGALAFCVQHKEVILQLAMFGLCAAVGQLFIFYIICEFGSLTCVTITITRKFFSILLSVAAFGHKTYWWQWAGVMLVFGGLGFNIFLKYTKKAVPVNSVDAKKKVE